MDGRILAIDYGKRRCGIAVSDPMQLIAGGLCTVETHRLLAHVEQYAARETVACIVVGYPMQMSGEASENAGRVSEFVRALQRKLPNIPVELADERFTSSLAHRTMIDAGLSRKRRQDKALVDSISATIILQSYLESKRFNQDKI